MYPNRRTLPVAFLLLSAWLMVDGTLAVAQYTEVDYNQEEALLYWNELPPLILNQTIELDLPDGAHVKGKVTGWSYDSLDVIIRETSDASNHPLGPTAIPRHWVETLTLHSVRQSSSDGGLGRTIGGMAGAMLGQPLALAIGAKGHEKLGLTVLFGAVAGGAALGDHLATRPEKTTIHIRIIPEGPPPAATPSPAPAAIGSPQHSSVETEQERSLGTRYADRIATTSRVTGKRLIRRGSRSGPTVRPAPDSWPVTPTRSRENWAF